MKKLLLYLFIILLVACKKTEYSPEGPTDIRVRNLSDVPFSEVIVNTSATIDTLGTIQPGEVSDYFRFEKAYPKAEISARINGQIFSTGTVDVTYMQYIGRDRITYEVFISNMNAREISISDVIIEEPLVLK
jgi:hypothetical protein